MKTLRILFAFLCLALVAQAQQRVPRTVPTVLDMLALDPKSLATRTVGTNDYFEAVVITLGDTVAPGIKKTWWWSASSTLPTNTAAAFGPLAWPHGSTAGRWLYVPEALSGVTGATLASAGVPGEIPVFATTNSIGASGIPTNQIRNISRVFPYVDDMLSDSPTNWASSSGGNLVWLETVSDSTNSSPGIEGSRRWRWEASSTLPTNTVAKGGPIAWPFGSSAGRYVQFARSGMYAPTDRIMVVPPLAMDAPDGTMSATDPKTIIQPIWDAASAAYDPILGKVKVKHPWGTYTGSELWWRGNVRYEWDYVWHYKKRNDPVGIVDRSICTTIRKGWINQDPVDGSFLSWATSGTNDFSIADHWYGYSDGIELVGSGKCIWDQNQKSCTQPLVRLLEVRDFWLNTPGLMEVWLAATTNADQKNSYAIQPCGRNILLNGVIIRGGTLYAQDGIHTGWGEYILIQNCFIDSGDDAFAAQAEAAGGFTSPPDEPLRHVRATNLRVYSKRGRGATIHIGNNQINVPYVNRTPTLQDIVVDGLFGVAAEQHSTGLVIGAWPDGTSIQNYTITSGGSGYSNGYWGLPITASVTNASGAFAMVKVEGGVITRCYPAKAGTWTGFVTVGTNAIGSTNINIGSGTGYVFAGDRIRFTGDATTYVVNSVSNNASITLTSGLAAGLGSGVALTIQSSTPGWKTGTGYRQDESPVVAGFIPGGSGAVIVANVYGTPNNLLADCGIQNFSLELGSTNHDNIEPIAFRVHGGTRVWLRNGRLSVTENSASPSFRPFVISGCVGADIQNVRVSPTTLGGQIAADIYPESVVDGLVIDNLEVGPHNKAGNGLAKFNGVVGSVVIRNSKFHVGTNGPALYIPDFENNRTCYVGRLELENNIFDSSWTNGTRQAVDLVPNLGGVPIIGFLKAVGNTFTNISTWDSTSVVQTSLSAYDIHGNTGGMRTELQVQVTQASGATTVSVPVSTYTGLIDATTASLPQIVGIVPVDYLGAWRLRSNSATAATLETASAPSSNSLWNVNIYTGRKPIGTGY